MEDAGTLWMWGIPWYNLVLHDTLCYCMVSEDTLFNLKYSKLGFKRLFKYKCELFEFSANHGIQPSHVILFQEKAVWLIEAQKSRERILNILLFVQKTWFWAKNGGSYIFFRKQIHQSKSYDTWTYGDIRGMIKDIWTMAKVGKCQLSCRLGTGRRKCSLCLKSGSESCISESLQSRLVCTTTQQYKRLIDSAQ